MPRGRAIWGVVRRNNAIRYAFRKVRTDTNVGREHRHLDAHPGFLRATCGCKRPIGRTIEAPDTRASLVPGVKSEQPGLRSGHGPLHTIFAVDRMRHAANPPRQCGSAPEESPQLDRAARSCDDLSMPATIIRPLQGRIEVRNLRGPRAGEPANKQMFKTAAGGPIRPTWVEAAPGLPRWQGYWTISRKHLSAVAEAIAIRDGEVLIEMHYSEHEQCDKRCRKAKGDDCTCSCEGVHHGKAQHAGWVQVGDTTLVRSSGKKVVTRRLTRKQALSTRAARRREAAKLGISAHL